MHSTASAVLASFSVTPVTRNSPAPASDGSAYQEYVLTEKGRGLFAVIIGLRQWGEGFFYAEGEAHSVLLDREHGQPLQALHVQAADGRVLGPLDCVRVAAQYEAEG